VAAPNKSKAEVVRVVANQRPLDRQSRATADPPILLNVREVAYLLGVSKSYAWERILPRLPIIREGRRVLVHREDVLAYAHQARETARGSPHI